MPKKVKSNKVINKVSNKKARPKPSPKSKKPVAKAKLKVWAKKLKPAKITIPKRQANRWYPDEVSKALKKWREANGWTKTELALKLGVVYRTYQNWEQGLRLPRGQAALGLCQILDEKFPKLMKRAKAKRAA